MVPILATISCTGVTGKVASSSLIGVCMDRSEYATLATGSNRIVNKNTSGLAELLNHSLAASPSMTAPMPIISADISQNSQCIVLTWAAIRCISLTGKDIATVGCRPCSSCLGTRLEEGTATAHSGCVAYAAASVSRDSVCLPLYH